MSGLKPIEILALANGYTDETVVGGGAIKGKNCQITAKTPIEGGTRITFSWFLDDGTEKTTTVDVMNGADGKDGEDGSQVEVNPIQKVGTKIGEITIDGVKYTLFAPSGGGGGGDAVLSDDLVTAISVGGIDSGVTYEAGTPLETLLRDLLEPTLYPSFTAPSASISYSASTYYAVGATVPTMSATVSLNRGAINPAYGTSGKRAGEATNYSIQTTGADTEYSETSASSGSFNVPALTRSTKGTIKVKGTVSYAQGEQPKDSKGNNYSSPLPAGSVNAEKTLNFIQPYYYGASDTASIVNFTGLTENVTAKGQKTFAFTTANQYQVIAYDASYGNLKSILDPNGFETISGWNKSSLTVGGFNYFVYVTASPTTDTNASFTFKY